MNREYERYLQSEAWREKRIQRLAIAKNRCAACTNHKAVHVHHLTYARIFNEDMADLLPLCEEHHWDAEELIKHGDLTRKGDVLFLAVETVRLILHFNSIHRRRPKKQKTAINGNWKKEQWRIMPLPQFSITARNAVQECLLSSTRFIVTMLFAEDRLTFKRDLENLINDPPVVTDSECEVPLPESVSRYMNNGCCIYDRFKREQIAHMEVGE